MDEKLTTTATTITTEKLGRAKDFDDLLKVVGSFGNYQNKMLYTFFMPACFFIAFTMNLFLFQMVVPNHWCHVPGREKTSLSVAEWHNITHLRLSDSGELSSCLVHEINFFDDGNGSRYSVTNNTKECSDGWEFDTSQFSATVATTLGWVCERNHYSHYTLSTSMAGNAVGSFLFPMLADKYVGRRLMFFMVLSLHIVFTIPLLWVTGPALHMFLRFLQGLSFETNYLMPFAIYMEIIPPERRAMVVMLSFLAWTFGMCFTALVAWLVPHWQYLAVISLFPSLLGFLYWRYLPESPRWLLAKGKVRQSADVLLEIGAANGTQKVSRTKLEAQLRVLMLQQPVDQPLTAMLAYPKLTIRAVMLAFMCLFQYLVYGVTMLSMTVVSNSFLAHFILSLFEIPSNFIGCVIAHYLGRRFTGYSNYLLLALCCLAAPFCTQNEWVLLTVIGFAKLFSTTGLYIVFLMAPEVLPTPVRTSAMGVTVVFGMMGMVLAPLTLHAGMGMAGHYWILFAVSIASAVTMIPLPETLGLPLPQTLQEGEDLGQGRPLNSWVHHWNLHRFPPPTQPTRAELGEALMQKP